MEILKCLKLQDVTPCLLSIGTGRSVIRCLSEYDYPGETWGCMTIRLGIMAEAYFKLFISVSLFLKTDISKSINKCFKVFFPGHLNQESNGFRTKDLVSILGWVANEFCDFGRAIYAWKRTKSLNFKTTVSNIIA